MYHQFYKDIKPYNGFENYTIKITGTSELITIYNITEQNIIQEIIAQ